MAFNGDTVIIIIIIIIINNSPNGTLHSSSGFPE